MGRSKFRSRTQSIPKPITTTTTTTKNTNSLGIKKAQTQPWQSNTSDHAGGLYLTEELEMEILSRLPVKSLMRFKCVCKRWEHLICENSWFIEMHHSRSTKCPCVLVVPKPMNTCIHTYGGYMMDSYLTATLPIDNQGKQTTTMRTLSEIESENLIFDDIIGPVNGLFGVVENFISVVTIYNFSTREVVQQCPWPRFLCYYETPEFQKYCFGFDSTSMTYKVVCFWRVVGERESCQVLTLGGYNGWRIITEKKLPTCCLEETAVYANNSIYWRSSVEDLRGLRLFAEQLSELDTNIDEVLVALDLGSEKFRIIPIPNSVPPDNSPSELINRNGDIFEFYPVLLELNGRVVISNRLDFEIIELYVLDENYVNKENALSTTGDMISWTKEIIELPIGLYYADIDIYPIPGGSDYILLICRSGHATTKMSPSLYLYNRKKKTIEVIVHDEWGSKFHHPHMYSTFVESLSPFRVPVQMQN